MSESVTRWTNEFVYDHGPVEVEIDPREAVHRKGWYEIQAPPLPGVLH